MGDDRLSTKNRNFKRNFIACCLLSILIISGIVHLIRVEQNTTSNDEVIIPSVNGETTGTVKLWKGEEYFARSSTYYIYGGSKMQAGTSTLTHYQYFFNVWIWNEAGCGQVYFEEGDTIHLGRLYVVQKVTDDYVILERK